jgi:hypothetical protein
MGRKVTVLKESKARLFFGAELFMSELRQEL